MVTPSSLLRWKQSVPSDNRKRGQCTDEHLNAVSAARVLCHTGVSCYSTLWRDVFGLPRPVYRTKPLHDNTDTFLIVAL